MDRTPALVRGTAVAAAFSLVLAPVHALARYRTEDGQGDLESGVVRAWAEPAAERLQPLLDWGSADTVYLTYGKLFFPLSLLAALAALSVRRSRPEPRGAEKWGWRIALPAYCLLVAGTFGSYWTPALDESFLFATVPGLLLSLLGSLVLGIGLLRRGFRPRPAAVLLVLWLPLMVVLSGVVAMGAGMVPWLAAWSLAARSLVDERDVMARPVALAPAG